MQGWNNAAKSWSCFSNPWSTRRAVMPGMVMFRRRWSVGSDDLVLPALFLFLLHCIWWVFLSLNWFVLNIYLFFISHDISVPRSVFFFFFLLHLYYIALVFDAQVGRSVSGSVRPPLWLRPVLFCNTGGPWPRVPGHPGQLPYLWECHHVVEHERQHSVYTAQGSCAVCHLYTAG